MAKEDEHFEIVFDDGAWDADTQRTHLQGKHAYTKSVAEIQHYVTALDRYDDFAEMSIPVSAYQKREGDYGIPFDPDIHLKLGEVLRGHQVTAAKRFLGQLRGFGLLADVVGSGKTFEAGIVLSELAAKGRLRSLLIVVPGQVLDAWVDVMENKFGMGRGALYQVRSEGEETLPPEKKLGNIVEQDNKELFYYPKRPIIVDVEVFSKWENLANVVFDAIVVDEAHHLSEEEGSYAHAMKLLSEMMVVKKAANSTYCLLLSATPHSGNLIKMFRLWYFIRCKGGNPSDFEEKDDRERTEEYRREKEYYLNYICNGAKNVSEYIRRTKLSQFAEGTKNRKIFDDWLAENHYPDFDGMTEYARSAALDAYLSENAESRANVLKKVAKAYHNTVMRSIMIRQPNNLPQKKNILSVLYFPMKNPVSKLSLTLDEPSGLKLTLDYTRTDEFNMPFVHSKLYDEDFNGSLKEFIDALVGDYIGWTEGDRNNKKHNIYCRLMNKVLAALKKQAEGENLFSKTKYVGFYNSVFDHLAKDKWYTLSILPVKYEDGVKLGYKYEYLKQVIRKNPQKRIVVFFDYELPKKKSVVQEVTEALKADFENRVIVSDSDKQAAAIIQKFNEKENAVLVVRKADFTEGANLQSSNIIVNYQVTPDPQAMDQRIGRVFRLGQKFGVFIHSLADINELEGYALGYFSGIGLMGSNSGDATILAGSNSDNMVTLRCPACGPVSIEIMSRVEYEELKRKFDKDPENSPLLCRHLTSKEHTVEKPLEKEEFSACDFKCDKCGHTICRATEEEGYHCSSTNNEGEQGYLGTDERPGGEKRTIYCSKLCAMRHCEFFQSPAMKGKCAVLNAYERQRNIGAEPLKLRCQHCSYSTQCPEKCKFKDDASGIASCSTCQYSGCVPKPYVLHFNDKWEADCPKCGKTRHGRLKPIVPSTFATFIRELWKYEQDGGDTFSKNLNKEMDRVAEIKAILSLDEESE